MQNKKFIDYNLLSKKDQEQLLGVAIGGEEKEIGNRNKRWRNRRRRDRQNLNSYPTHIVKHNLDSYSINKDKRNLDSYPTHITIHNLDSYLTNIDKQNLN